MIELCLVLDKVSRVIVISGQNIPYKLGHSRALTGEKNVSMIDNSETNERCDASIILIRSRNISYKLEYCRVVSWD